MNALQFILWTFTFVSWAFYILLSKNRFIVGGQQSPAIYSHIKCVLVAARNKVEYNPCPKQLLKQISDDMTTAYRKCKKHSSQKHTEVKQKH